MLTYPVVDRSQQNTPGSFGSPRPSLNSGIVPGSPLAASPHQSPTQTGYGLPAPLPGFHRPLPSFAGNVGITAASLVPNDGASKTPGRKPKTPRPNVTLQQGFAWDRASLTLLAYWKLINKKGSQLISDQGNFPGKTAQQLDEAWKQHSDRIKTYWEEYEAAAKT
tara:strand:+ start:19014 stop:19508 length:495 start_codon:yes stop_codon:yes gene_type:complete